MITEYYEEKCLLNCGKKKNNICLRNSGDKYVYCIVGRNMFTEYWGELCLHNCGKKNVY